MCIGAHMQWCLMQTSGDSSWELVLFPNCVHFWDWTQEIYFKSILCCVYNGKYPLKFCFPHIENNMWIMSWFIFLSNTTNKAQWGKMWAWQQAPSSTEPSCWLGMFLTWWLTMQPQEALDFRLLCLQSVLGHQ